MKYVLNYSSTCGRTDIIINNLYQAMIMFSSNNNNNMKWSVLTFWHSSVSLMSITILMVFNAINLMCLYCLVTCLFCKLVVPVVDGLFNVLKAFDFFLHTSNWSENRKSTRLLPLLAKPFEDTWTTSAFVIKLRCDETMSGCWAIINI